MLITGFESVPSFYASTLIDAAFFRVLLAIQTLRNEMKESIRIEYSKEVGQLKLKFLCIVGEYRERVRHASLAFCFVQYRLVRLRWMRAACVLTCSG